jgi:hypothetical protein
LATVTVEAAPAGFVRVTATREGKFVTLADTAPATVWLAGKLVIVAANRALATVTVEAAEDGLVMVTA